MKHPLSKTTLYGIGGGILLYFLINNPGGGVISFLLLLLLFFVVLVLFLVTEILTNTDSTTPNAKSKRTDKITLFTTLVLTGAGIALVALLSKANWDRSPSAENISEGDVMAICLGCPFGLIYIFSLLSSLVMFTRSQSRLSDQETTIATDDPTLSTVKKKGVENYFLRLLILFGVVTLGCIMLVFVNWMISLITSFKFGGEGFISSIISTTILLIMMLLSAFGAWKLIQLLRR